MARKKTSSVRDPDTEHWFKAHWRPMMAYIYMMICFMDFIGFPLLAMFGPVMGLGSYTPWKSLSLENGGLIHMAFGAILGITAWTRGAEKKAWIDIQNGPDDPNSNS